MTRMAMMLSQLYDALRAAGAPDEQARKAAEEVAGFASRSTLIAEQVASLRAEVRVVQAVGGVIVVLMMALFWQMFAIRSELEGRFARLEAGQELVVGRVAKLEQRMDGVEKRLDRVEQRLDKVEQRLDGMDQRLGRIEQLLEALARRP